METNTLIHSIYRPYRAFGIMASGLAGAGQVVDSILLCRHSIITVDIISFVCPTFLSSKNSTPFSCLHPNHIFESELPIIAFYIFGRPC